MAVEQTTERPGYWDVPGNWKWLPIGEVVNLAPDNNNVTEEKLTSNEGDIPIIFSRDLKNTKEITSNRRTTQLLLDQINIKPSEEPRILLARARAETVGRVGIFKGKAVHNRGVHAIIPRQDIVDLDYLFYCFRADEINSRIVEEVIVQGKTAIRKEHTRQVMIPVPSLPEQQRIVERIEILLKDVEQARALLQQTKQDIENVTHSVIGQNTTDTANQDDIGDQIARMRGQATQSEQLLKAIEQRILSEALRGNLYREGQ